jgi:hypothetical protein
VGFLIAPKTYDLHFEGREYEGLRVSMRGLALGNYLEIQRITSVKEENTEDTEKMISIFLDSIVSWNLEEMTEDGIKTLPMTREGVDRLDTDFVMTIIGSWLTAMAGVPAPLEQNSKGGSPSLEASMPMEVSSANQSS